MVDALLAAGAALLVAYLVLLAVLLAASPQRGVLRESLRLVPDLLVARLAREPAVPRRTRWLLVALGAYLALPIDLVPDVVPVLGYADDLLAIRIVLRRVVRAAGPEVVRAAWPGTPEGLRAVGRLLGVPLG